MRLLHLYLIAYFLLLLGAGIALWDAGVLSHVRPLWVVLGTSVTIGLGVLLAITGAKPPVVRE